MEEERYSSASSDSGDDDTGAKFTLSQGTGTPLGELPAVQAVGKRGAACKQLETQLEPLHRLVFGRAGKTGERRRALEPFCGFPADMREEVLQKVHKLKKDKLRDLIKGLGMPVHISKTQSQVADDVTDFLMEPRGERTKVRADTSKGKAVKRARKSPSPRGATAGAVAAKRDDSGAGDDKSLEEKPKRVKKEVPVAEGASLASPPSDDAIRVAVYKRIFVTPREERARLTTKTLRLELEKSFGDLEGRKAVIKEAASECVSALAAAEEAVSVALAAPAVYTSRNGSHHAVEPSPAPQPPQCTEAAAALSFARSQAPPQATPDACSLPQSNVPAFPAFPPAATDAVFAPPQEML